MENQKNVRFYIKKWIDRYENVEQFLGKIKNKI